MTNFGQFYISCGPLPGSLVIARNPSRQREGLSLRSTSASSKPQLQCDHGSIVRAPWRLKASLRAHAHHHHRKNKKSKKMNFCAVHEHDRGLFHECSRHGPGMVPKWHRTGERMPQQAAHNALGAPLQEIARWYATPDGVGPQGASLPPLIKCRPQEPNMYHPT